MLSKIKAFGWFWYDFIVGDDWTVAVGVVCILAISWLINQTNNGLAWLFLTVATLALLFASVKRGAK